MCTYSHYRASPASGPSTPAGYFQIIRTELPSIASPVLAAFCTEPTDNLPAQAMQLLNGLGRCIKQIDIEEIYTRGACVVRFD